jgi:hypothetical protein
MGQWVDGEEKTWMAMAEILHFAQNARSGSRMELFSPQDLVVLSRGFNPAACVVAMAEILHFAQNARSGSRIIYSPQDLVVLSRGLNPAFFRKQNDSSGFSLILLCGLSDLCGDHYSRMVQYTHPQATGVFP